MLVTTRSAHVCCGEHHSDFGSSPNSKAKTRLRRLIKRRERQHWQREVRGEDSARVA